MGDRACGACYSWICNVLTSLAMPKFKIMQNLVDRLNLVSREILTGLNVIRAFGGKNGKKSGLMRPTAI